MKTLMAAILALALPATSSLHVHLTRAEPATGSTVRAAPTAIQLWFSEEIQISVTTVRLTGPDSAQVVLTAPALGDGAHPPVVVMVRGTMKPGRQQVAWRTMSRDGHAVSGTFAFTLAPAAGTASRR